MTCHEVDDLLGAYRDRELDLSRSLEVEAHLRGCATCAEDLRRLEALSQVVAEQAPYYRAPARLRSKLQANLAPPREPWFARWPAWVAACAMAALVIWRLAPAPGSGAMEQEVVAAHVRSLLADHLLDVPSSDRHTVKPWFAGKLDFAPEVDDLAAQGFVLAGGRLDYLEGRTVAALVYHRRQHTINVFTWPSDRQQASPVATTVQGYHLVHWVSHGMNWWAVSDLAMDELSQLPRLL